MEEALRKMASMDKVKGVWWWNNKKIKEFLNIPLDINTTRQLKDILPKLSKLFEDRMFKDEVGCVFESDFLLFKKVNKDWIVIWVKRDIPLALLRMEVTVTLNEWVSRKSKGLKKLKFW